MAIQDQIESTQAALEQAQAELSKIEDDYNKLKAQVVMFQQHLKNLHAVAGGEYSQFVQGGEKKKAAPTQRRRGSAQLKQLIYEYFETHPLMVQSPKGICLWLMQEKGLPEKGLRARVSNLLRKIVNEESWLQRAGHGKYKFKQG